MGTPQLLGRDQMVNAAISASCRKEALHDDKPERVASWVHGAGVA
jgi:hypothetical protein